MVLTTFTLSVELLSNEQTLGHKLLVQLQDMSVKVTTEVAEVEAPKVSVDDSGKVSTLPTSVSTSRRHMLAPTFNPRQKPSSRTRMLYAATLLTEPSGS